MSAKARNAIDLIVTTGATQREAANKAGMNEGALSRALARPEVHAYFIDQKNTFAMEMNDLKDMASKIAIKTAMELMQTGTPAIKAKMVEFFAGERRAGTQITVNSKVEIKGYEYAKPGQRVVDVLDAEVVPDQVASPAKQGDIDTPSDMQSVGQVAQGIEDAE